MRGSAVLNAVDIKRVMLSSLGAAGVIPEADIQILLTETVELAGLPLDSLTLIEFCMRIEEFVGIPIEPTDIVQHQTLDDLAADLSLRSAKS